MKAVAIVLASLLAACGSSTSLELGAHAEGLDASTACDDASAASDAAEDVPSDAVFYDHGTNGDAALDAPLPACTSQQDCDGWATCQNGLCCSGTLVGDVCMCGDSPGCDLRHTCCVPFDSTTGKPECVADCASRCGCGAPPK